MELITLNPFFQPVKLIDNYDSIIWTERYSSNGDFEIVTSDIETMLKALPLESYVSLRDSNVPMVVEVHKIVKPLRGAPKLTIMGRSFETVLERRASIFRIPDTYPIVPWEVSAAKGSDAAWIVMRNVLGDEARTIPGAPPEVTSEISGVDVASRTSEDDLFWRGTTYASRIIDIPPPIDFSIPDDPDPYIKFPVNTGDLYSTIIEMISTSRRGFKAVRPADESQEYVSLEIYNGADLTESVSFDARFDQFNSSTYLFSRQGSTNVAYIFGPDAASEVLKNAGPSPKGLDRRVLYLDETSTGGISGDAELRRQRALVELYKYNSTALFDGEIAEQIAVDYNKKYFLGDIISLVGEYDLSTNVRVAEFIRSSDASGRKAYPAFEVVDD